MSVICFQDSGIKLHRNNEPCLISSYQSQEEETVISLCLCLSARWMSVRSQASFRSPRFLMTDHYDTSHESWSPAHHHPCHSTSLSLLATSQETSCPSECFTLESGGSICSSKASKLENPSVLIQSLDSAASPSQSTIKIYIPWLFKLIIWKWKVKFKLHLFTILLSCRFSSKFILKLRDPQSFSDTDSWNGFGFAQHSSFFPR